MASVAQVRKPPTDWKVARAFYLGLPAQTRTLKAVADRFGVSDVRVSQVAKRDRWTEAALERDREEAQAEAAEESRLMREVVRRRARTRADRLAATLEVYDRVADVALELLPLDKEGRVKPGEANLERIVSALPGLFRMAELAAGEATDRVAIAEVQPVLAAFARVAILAAPAERRGDVLRELQAASAGLVELPALPAGVAA